MSPMPAAGYDLSVACRVALEQQELQRKADSGLLAYTKSIAGRTQTNRVVLSVHSSSEGAQPAWEQLRVLAELVLMHGKLHADLSDTAWFPADSFVVQFQQDKYVPCFCWGKSSLMCIARIPTHSAPQAYDVVRTGHCGHSDIACLHVVWWTVSMSGGPAAGLASSPSGSQAAEGLGHGPLQRCLQSSLY